MFWLFQVQWFLIVNLRMNPFFCSQVKSFLKTINSVRNKFHCVWKELVWEEYIWLANGYFVLSMDSSEDIRFDCFLMKNFLEWIFGNNFNLFFDKLVLDNTPTSSDIYRVEIHSITCWNGSWQNLVEEMDFYSILLISW
jgi:hypothetical protein